MSDRGVNGPAGPQPGERIAELRFLIHDRDPLFSSEFREAFAAEGFRIIATMPHTPRMNAICERVIGTLRRELLDRILILRERHLAQRAPAAPVPATTSTDTASRPARDVTDLNDLRSIHRNPWSPA
ncbi:hypothetical protein [Nonomuraea jabiensis]|uniref:hypothetical protein n=1 Tax=Nonomuraea jabiensis TaxID=882448 RepID=UPI00368F6916